VQKVKGVVQIVDLGQKAQSTPESTKQQQSTKKTNHMRLRKGVRDKILKPEMTD
jgi:hypothetical protein